MNDPVTLLLVEDNAADARLVQELLDHERLGKPRVVQVDTLKAAIAAADRESFDVVLLDLSLPDSRGMKTFHTFRESVPAVPIVILTGFADEATSIEALSFGAQDYLPKDHADRHTLNRAIRYAIYRKHALRLEAERRGLEAAVRSMEHVIAVVGHELRAPLFAFRLLLESMSSGSDVLGRERTIQVLLAQAAIMSDTVTNVLEAARLDSGMPRWNWQPFAFKAVIEPAFEIVQPLLESGVELNSIIEPPDLMMEGDLDAVRRVLINLLSNAAKHTHHGAITVAAREVFRDDQRWIQLSVTDTGRGIPAHVRKRLGVAFALNTGVVSGCTTGGIGLGLSICSAIAAAHGGEVHVESDGESGSSFTVWLRADRSGPVIRAAADDRKRQEASKTLHVAETSAN